MAFNDTPVNASPTIDRSSPIGNSPGADGRGRMHIKASNTQGEPIWTNLNDGSGNPIDSLVDTLGKRNLLTAINQNIAVSTGNSSIANIAAGATFSGVVDGNLNANGIQINLKSDQPVTVTLLQSNDGVHFDFSDSYTLDTNQGDARFFIASGSYFKVTVRNDSTSATTYFNLQTIVCPISTVLPRSLTDNGNLKTSIEEIGSDAQGKLINSDRSIFGSGIVGSRVSLLTGDFYQPLNSNDVTTSFTGTGSVVQGSGAATLSTGTGTTSSAKMTSNRTLRYAIERELFVVFSATFTTPTNINSSQRVGLYDSNNGTYLGFQGTTFGVSIRRAGVDTFIPRTSFNKDKLNGTSSSNFFRNGIPEAVDFTKFNTYRIRAGRATSIDFEIYTPDGEWLVFHTFQSVNSLTQSVVQSSNLPYTYEVIKTASDATNIIINTSGIDVGVVDFPQSYSIEDIKSRSYRTGNLSNQTTSQTIYTVSTGRRLKVTNLIANFANSSLVANGLLEIRDGTGGTILLPLTSPPSTNQSNAGNNINVPFSVPLRFTNSIYANIASGTLTYSLTFVGYEEEA